MRYYISDIKQIKSKHGDTIYATLRDENHDIVISATLDYILKAIEDRCYGIIPIRELVQIKNNKNEKINHVDDSSNII